MVVGTEFMNAGQHVVQFYGRDEELAERVAAYLLGALTEGGAAVVIATAAHRQEFEARLRRAGVDLDAAADRDAYLVLDAAELAREFMAGDQLDGAGFRREIGGLIQDAGAGGRPVRAYAEMVAMLWDAGLVNAAVQLETRWNELGREHAFSLFCGYPARALPQDEPDAFAEVCRLHGEFAGHLDGSRAPPGRRAPSPFPGTRPRRPAISRSVRCGAGPRRTSPTTPPWS